MAAMFNADEHQAVFLPICATCGFVLRSPPMFLIDGRTYWGVLPQEHSRYEASCRNLDVSHGKGIYGCSFMREALNPWLRSGPEPPPPTHAKPETITPAADESVWPPARGMREIMARFQSLGDNCEFGLLQRWARVETLDLLRFASFYGQLDHSLRLTINAISEGFSGLGDPDSTICELHGAKPPRQHGQGDALASPVSHRLR